MKAFLFKQAQHVEGFLAGDATHIKEIFHPKNDTVSLPYSLAWGSIEIGASSLPHTLANEELYYILEGEGVIFIEGEQVSVTKGDALLIHKDKEQYVKNTGTEKLVFLCIVSPPWEAAKEEILIKE